MKITAQEEYAMRCLGQLARADARTTISRVADVVGLSDENTAKIIEGQGISLWVTGWMTESRL